MPDTVDAKRDVRLSPADLTLLIEALDSHEYWQIGEVLPRNNGMVWIPGDCADAHDRYWHGTAPDGDQLAAIRLVQRCRELADRLRGAGVDD
jgi:hypothetical protein